MYYRWNIYYKGDFIKEVPLVNRYSRHKLALRSAVTYALKNIL